MPRVSRNASGTVPPDSTISSILSSAPVEPLEARILLSHVLALTRVQLVTQGERRLTEEEALRLTAAFQRRLSGEPIAYIVGEREFFGLRLATTPDVLIPRPETELLVELALERIPRNGCVLDMGTGSGAIALAIAHMRPDCSVTALDASAAALRVAEANAARHGLTVSFLLSDWYAALPDAQFDLIVANPPYIVAGDPHLGQGDLRFEPLDALTDHGDGLGALRSIVDGALKHLAPDSWLLMEHGYDQAAAVRELLERQGLQQAQSWRDLAGIERVSGGRR